MTLGQYIKQLRTQYKLSQPQLAERMQVEQSYLSKLENDKSTPSNEVFRQLLDALEMNVGTFMSGLKKQGNLALLRNIPDIDAWFITQKQMTHTKQRNLLYTAMLLIAFGVASFYTGWQTLLLPETQYEYRSMGVVLEGEPEDIFRMWSRLTESKKEREEKSKEMLYRENIKNLITFDYQGSGFVVKDNNKRRKYDLIKETKQARVGNMLMQFIGLFSAVLGLVLLVIEPKLSRQPI
jgi:transcriptional regulator with XRE-family HTH domain